MAAVLFPILKFHSKTYSTPYKSKAILYSILHRHSAEYTDRRAEKQRAGCSSANPKRKFANDKEFPEIRSHSRTHTTPNTADHQLHGKRGILRRLSNDRGREKSHAG